MKTMTRFGAGLVTLALAVGTLACQSTPVRFDAPATPRTGAQGRTVSGAACGFQLLLLIPIAVNSRQSRAYAALQQAEFDRQAEAGYEAVKHQRFVGTGYFDQVAQCVAAGQASTTGLSGSTEEAQFVSNGR